jgi:hypothetical protein
MTLALRNTIPVLLLSIAFAASPVLAADPSEEGLALMAGQWIFDVRVQMPMQAKPSTQTLKSCVTSEPITAETLMPWAEAQGCKIRSVKVRDNELSWKLRCKLNGQKSRGPGKFSVDGEEGEGKATVSFDAGGRRMSIVTRWDARRVGACSAASAGNLSPPAPQEPEEDE